MADGSKNVLILKTFSNSKKFFKAFIFPLKNFPPKIKAKQNSSSLAQHYLEQVKIWQNVLE